MLCVNPQPLSKVELDHAGAEDTRWVHSCSVRTYAPADSPADAVRTRNEKG